MQAVSEAVGSVAVLTGRMKDILSKIETNGGVENSKAENSKSENGEADLEMKGNGPVMIGGTGHSTPGHLPPQPSTLGHPTPSHPIPTHPVYGQNVRRYPCLPESSGIFFLAYFFIFWPLS